MPPSLSTAPIHGPTVVALFLGLALLWPAVGQAEPDASEREQALEARVEALERKLERLLAESDTDDTSPETEDEPEEPRLEDRVATLEEQPDPARAITAVDSTSLTYGGFIKTDVLWSRFSDGALPARNVGRDFYVPATVPVGGESSGTDLDIHAKESRFWFRTDTELEDGSELSGYLEFDFTSSAPGGDERLTNAYSPSIRHAWLQYNDLLLGQSWSNFQILGALPENLDFVGPAEGTVFVRQPQIRYTRGPWQFSAENPETTATPFGGGERIVTDTGWMPDFTARYNLAGERSSFSVAGLVRQMAIRDNGSREREPGFGLTLGGRVDIGERNDFRYMATWGSGVGRYLGLNTANDAVLTADGGLDAIDAFGGFVSYRHFWHPAWRSNLTLSGQWIDNDAELTGPDATRDSISAHVNLIHQVNPALSFGVEYLHARRRVESGESGSLDRLQFSGMYNF